MRAARTAARGSASRSPRLLPSAVAAGPHTAAPGRHRAGRPQNGRDPVLSRKEDESSQSPNRQANLFDTRKKEL